MLDLIVDKTNALNINFQSHLVLQYGVIMELTTKSGENDQILSFRNHLPPDT